MERVKQVLERVFGRKVVVYRTVICLLDPGKQQAEERSIAIRDISGEPDCLPDTYEVIHSGLDPVAVEGLDGLVASVAMAIFDRECKE